MKRLHTKKLILLFFFLTTSLITSSALSIPSPIIIKLKNTIETVPYNDIPNKYFELLKKDPEHAEDYLSALKELKSEKAHFLLGWINFYINKNYEEAFKWFKKGQEDKNSEAVNYLGIMKKDGLGTKKDIQQARAYFSEAIEIDNNINAHVNLGKLYMGFTGIPKDLEKAKEHLHFAATSGNTDAMYTLGLINSMEKKHKQALSWYKKTANLGNTDAMYILGFINGIKKEYKQSQAWYEKAAKLGDKESQYQLANIYRYGNSEIKKDIAKAKEWYKKASALGHSESANELGLLSKDDGKIAEAEKFFLEAIEIDNNLNATFNLATLYRNQKKYKKAIELFQKGIKRNDDSSINSLGVMYLNGYGVKKDYKKAFELFKKAIKVGNNLEAQTNLGVIYMSGFGVTKNVEKAKELYKKPANMGVSLAQFNLGLIYYKIEKNTPKAIKWLKLAAENNYSQAYAVMAFISAEKKEYQDAVHFCQEAIKIDNNSEALARLGMYYYKGWGVKRDLSKAKEYFLKAKKQNHPDASFWLSLIYEGNELIGFSNTATVVHIKGKSSFPKTQSALEIKKFLKTVEPDNANKQSFSAFEHPEKYRAQDGIQY